ncbi:MAG: AbgT family transporter [Halanaerobiaceae bacterium]
MSNQSPQESSGLADAFLDRIERVGNRLPHPMILFFIMALIVIIVSAIVSELGIQVEHPTSGETIEAFNLLSAEGFQRILTEAVENFTGFAPLGVVLVAMLGVGVADKGGLISATLKKFVMGTPDKYITSAVVFAGVMSNVASDAGYVVLVPLGAIIFSARGRHPIVGLAAAFAGVSGGFSANLLLSTLDPMMAGISQEAAQLIDSGYMVDPSVNYYFMIVSTFLITVVGTWVTEKIVAPRFGEYTGDYTESMEEVTPRERKGLKAAGLALLVFIVILLIMTVPESGILRSADGELIGGSSPFVGGMVPLIALLFIIPGIAYGKSAGTIESSDDIAEFMEESMNDMGAYVALAFAAGQFVAYFEWTNIGTILAISGAEFLETIGFTGLPFVIVFILVSGFINLFVGSASAKWAIMAPVFVPLMMQLDYAPEFAQMAYRIGDSTTNIITPLMPYFAIIIAFAQKWDEDIGLGTLISTMVPYSIAFMIAWTFLLIIWFIFGLPLGPAGSIFL